MQKNSLKSWFSTYRQWLDNGKCDEMLDGIDPFLKTVPKKEFKACLFKWLTYDSAGIEYERFLKFDDSGTVLEGWTQTV